MGHHLKVIASNDDQHICRRAAERWRVMLSAILQTPTGEIPVRLRDVSQTGALVVSPVQPPVGSNVAFFRGSIWVAATVVRVEGSNVALRFREAIDKAALLVAIGKPALKSKPLEPLFAEPREIVPHRPLPGEIAARRGKRADGPKEPRIRHAS